MFNGININKDPILSSIVKAKELNDLILMKHKNRIILPESASLIGVVDPYGILEEN